MLCGDGCGPGAALALVIALLAFSASSADLEPSPSPGPISSSTPLDEPDPTPPPPPMCPTASTHFQCDLSRCVLLEKHWENGTCGQRCAEFAPICLHRRHLCDGHQDCADGSDERDCVQCAITAFACDGRCVRKELRCDSHRHCQDGGDESDCPSLSSPQSLFACSDLSTIHRNATCDGVPDCPQGEDEKACSECNGGAVYCDGRCIRVSKRCDLVRDCSDGSDEAGCPVNMRAVAVVDKRDPLQKVAVVPECFHCGNGRCIDSKYKCDGVDNCLNDKDEKRCFQPVCRDGRGRNCVATRCGARGMPCRALGYRCGRAKWRCDGHPHCDAAEDELGCDAQPQPDWFACADGTARPAEKWCDSRPDCPGGEDESSCPSAPPPVFCKGNETLQRLGSAAPGQAIECPPAPTRITCKDGSTRLSSVRCDGVPDCPGGDDEENCSRCEDGALLCGGRCVMASKRCDGYLDCPNGDDERGCLDYLAFASTFFHPTVCGVGRFSCGAKRKCILSSHVCDGVRDCESNADEVNCLRCQGGAFLCNGRCLRRVHACHWEKEPCAELQGRQVGHEFWARELPESSGNCDGFADCADGRDEKASCTGSAVCSGFWCDGKCKPTSVRCDGHADCERGEDEVDCPEGTPSTVTTESWDRQGGTVLFTWTYSTSFTFNGTLTNVSTVINDTVAVITTIIEPPPEPVVPQFVAGCPDEPQPKSENNGSKKGRKQRKRKRKQRQRKQKAERKRNQERKQQNTSA